MSRDASGAVLSVANDGPSDSSDLAQTQDMSSTKHLDFVSGNGTKEETILLIHGAAASGTDWSLVTPHLSSYHLLVPSLFSESSLRLVRQTRFSSRSGGSTSSTPRPWISCYASHVSQLIKVHAKNGQAHIVGLSFGGCLAVEFATSYPELTLSLFVSGLPAVRSQIPSIMRPVGTGVMWTMHSIARLVGAGGVNKFLDGEVDSDPGFWDGKGGGATVEMNAILSETFIYTSTPGKCPYITRLQAKIDDKYVEDQGLRIRLVAATRKSKWTPAADSPALAIEIAGLILEQKKQTDEAVPSQRFDCRVYKAERMFHPWNRQLPELFAKCILSTVEGTDFPTDGLEEIWKNDRATSAVK